MEYFHLWMWCVCEEILWISLKRSQTVCIQFILKFRFWNCQYTHPILNCLVFFLPKKKRILFVIISMNTRLFHICEHTKHLFCVCLHCVSLCKVIETYNFDKTRDLNGNCAHHRCRCRCRHWQTFTRTIAWQCLD